MIAFAKYGDMAASTRQRLLQYLPFLERNGVEVDVFPLLDNDHLARLVQGRRASVIGTMFAYAKRLAHVLSARRYDLIWIHYELFPFLPSGFETMVRLAGKPIVVDFDDAVFHLYDQHPNPLVRRFLARKLEPLLSSAAVCVCGNAYLENYAARFCRNSIVIPTVVDTRDYMPQSRDAIEDRPVVGWIGSPSTWTFVEPLLPLLRPYLESRGALFRAVGAGVAAAGIAGIDTVDWNEATEIAEVQAMDIGIMPLPDEPWARGKCGYKLVQYMACGLPVIASPVGVNCEIVTNGWNGFLAQGPECWLEALGRLLSDRDLRLEMGRRGRSRVEQDYSLASQETRLFDALKLAMKAGIADGVA